jgi:hypothetical protein
MRFKKRGTVNNESGLSEFSCLECMVLGGYKRDPRDAPVRLLDNPNAVSSVQNNMTGCEQCFPFCAELRPSERTDEDGPEERLALRFSCLCSGDFTPGFLTYVRRAGSVHEKR